MMYRPRQSGPKVRTGCRTCKIRRVKCDEQKPACLRCTSTGRQCDGYPNHQPEFRVRIWSHYQACSLQQTVSMPSTYGDSVRYLEFYHHFSKFKIQTNFDKEFWSRIVLQMAHTEPCVRHALIALGYLHSTETGSLKHARSKFVGQKESGTLLYHYNTSIKCLIERMEDVSYVPEIGLVACLLYVCMEFLRANYHTGFQHLTNGLKIISEYNKRTCGDSFVSPPSKSLDEPSTTTSFERSALIEDELRPIFVEAIASALLYGVDVEKSINVSDPSPRHYQTLHFKNLREAQISAHELRNQSILLIRDMSQRIVFTYEIPFTPKELKRQAVVLECQRAWHGALTKYRCTHTLSGDEELTVSALLTHHHATHIWAACVGDICQTAFDAHLESFQTILYHARLVLDSMDSNPFQPAANFTFRICIIPAIYFVATRCRCPVTRREAVNLLARNPPREALWDAEQHVVVLKRVIEIEEKVLDPVTGWPGEETRLWSSVIDANMDSRGGFWAYFTPIGWLHEKATDGKPKTVQEHFIL
ncbi:hypothetical protein GQ44DRAFT_652071 [Phaeosphaeriaceae sp. PMI808]|nr:hypothetical protein GQ44DRAFT_652071 [Phaeosphaeriaceae sp. PMI808]